MTALFLGAYDFDGDLDSLLPAYERLMAGYPPGSVDLHVCVTRPGGITVYDACPSQEVFRSFSGSAEFAGVVSAAGLPAPRVTELGPVHAAQLRQPVPAQ